MRFDSAALRAARVDHDLSQRQLADEAGVSVATISRLEGGSARHPRAGIILRLARTLDLRVTTLIHDE